MTTNQLISFHIIERESDNNKYLTWTYPTITEELKNYLLLKSFYHDYICIKKNNIFIYMKRIEQTDNNIEYNLIILTKEYEPIKYKQICDIFSKEYIKNGNPVDLVKLYLNLFTYGNCKFQENGTLVLYDLKNFQSRTNVKGLIQSFHLEIILIFIAILLKRRILLYHPNVALLQKVLFSVIHLVPCRKSMDNIYPFIENSKELKGLSFYLAGTVNEGFVKNHTLYDLFVNMETLDISVSSQAEEILSIVKAQKELATFLVKLAESDLNDEQIKEQISIKTDKMIGKLKQSASQQSNGISMININELKARNLNPTTENFLFNLALAENIMML